MNPSALWTLDELVARVAAALAETPYPGAPNGRVREIPDRRAVRWYATIGLVDRPAAMRGRTALYGPRHLRQIVAVKRRQAEGRSLAEIQAELAGATDGTLREVAAIGDDEIATDPPETPTPRRRFWADRPTADDADPVADSVTALAAVQLPGGVVVLLPRQPEAKDLSAIGAAARPLLDLLADLNLFTHEERRPS